VAGLSAAWQLSRDHDVLLYEREMRLGGHANTIDAGTGAQVPIDTGFIVYNTACYPNLVALFDHLAVETARTDMGFAVSLDGGTYEYCGNSLSGFFGQRCNLLSPRHWRMGKNVLRFFKHARQLAASKQAEAETLGAWLARGGYSRWFIERHIVPMGAAIWSTPASKILEFPAAAFARFFANHGLLQLNDRPEWRTVRGGSRTYVRKLVEAGHFRVSKGDPVVSILRGPGGVAVRTANGSSTRFDRCLIATHADEVLRLLPDADDTERRVLGAFRYSRNQAVLHTDASLMPRRRNVWSSWNYLDGGGETGGVALTYWMNRLQPLETSDNYFVSINPNLPVAEERVSDRTCYEHPLFDAAAMAAQRELWSLQGRRRTWFAGSYFAFGFHECALQAGLAAAEDLGGGRRPWNVAGENDRLSLPPGTAGSGGRVEAA
jgi:hypothetical protein